MGILNVTPDSFSDGGQFFHVQSALEHANAMIEHGAAVIDIGGESTRPGHTPVDAEEERRRVLPVIEALRAQSDIPISVDTSKADVADAALAVGADIINDVSCLADDSMCAVLKKYSAGCIVMHCAKLPPEEDAVHAVTTQLTETITQACDATGLPREFFMADPGIGFGKSDAQIFALLRHLDTLHQTGCATLLGVSRKSFIGRLCGEQCPVARLGGTLAVALACRNQCEILRVHDVALHREALMTSEQIAQC